MPAVVGTPSSASADASGTTVSVVRAGVTAGNGILLYTKYEGGSSDVISSVSDGTTDFTASKSFHGHASGFAMAWFYLTASVASGSVTYTVTLSSAMTFKRIVVMELSHTGALTIVSPTFADDGGSSTYPAPASITNTDADALFAGSWSDFSGVSTSSELLGGAARDGVKVEAFDSVWWKVYASAAARTSGATLSGAATGIGSVIAVQEAAGGGGPTPGGGNMGGMIRRVPIRPRAYAPGLAR